MAVLVPVSADCDAVGCGYGDDGVADYCDDDVATQPIERHRQYPDSTTAAAVVMVVVVVVVKMLCVAVAIRWWRA